MTNLFRKEVVSKPSSRLEGEICLAVAPPVRRCHDIAGHFSDCRLGSARRFQLFEDGDSVGARSPATGLIVVHAPAADSVKDLMVHQGALVREGKALLVLGQQQFLDSSPTKRSQDTACVLSEPEVTLIMSRTGVQQDSRK